MTVETAPSAVRLSITRIDLDALWAPGEVLLDVEETSELAAERARSWAQVRGFDRLVTSIDRVPGGFGPAAGWAVIINKPNSLMLLATWPWCPVEVADDRRFLPPSASDA
jgi:hypothetical protein